MATVRQLLDSLIGQVTGRSTVVIERGPVSFFAEAVLATDRAYQSPEAAAAAGLADVRVPPTYPFVMDHWGAFAELQPTDAPQSTTMLELLGPLLADGGLLLHGEQEFIYYRPVVVGDVLTGEAKVVDAYQKESKGHTMTFVVVRTDWTDRATGESVVTSTFNIIHRA